MDNSDYWHKNVFTLFYRIRHMVLLLERLQRNNFCFMHIKIIVIFLSLLFMDVSICDSAEQSEAIREKTKAAYFYLSDGPEHLKMLSKHGFNQGLVKIGLPIIAPENDKETLNKLKTCVEFACENDIQLVPVLNLLGNREISFLQSNITRRYTQPDDGKFEKTPCPLDEGYWSQVIAQRIPVIARLASKKVMPYILIDIEPYSTDFGIAYAAPCLCAGCFTAFKKAFNVNIVDDLQEKATGVWLEANGMLPVYSDFQKKRLTEITENIRGSIQKEFPDLGLGIVFYYDTWFTHALIQGFGSANKPCLVYDETTYCKEYNQAEINHFIESLGANAIGVFGLWVGKWLPDDLASMAFRLSTHSQSGGYWCWTTHSLSAPQNELKNDYYIPAAQDKYWAALAQANNELRKWENDSAYKSNFKFDKVAPVTRTVDKHLSGLNKRISDLRPLCSKPPTPTISNSFLRSYAQGFIYLSQGQRTQITISCHPVKKEYQDTLIWALTDCDGKVITDGGTVALNQSKNLEFTAPKDGVYSIIGDSGKNLFSMCASDCGQVYSTNPYCHFFKKIAQNLYFFVPRTVKEFTVIMRTGCIGKTVACDVVSPNGETFISVEGCFLLDKKLKITVPEGVDGNVWGLRMRAAQKGNLEDVFLYFSENIPPFVAENKDMILIPAVMAAPGK